MTEDKVIARKPWLRRNIVIISGMLFSLVVIVVILCLWDEIQNAAGYGYAGCFVVSVMAGMTVIPAPALPVVFTLGHKLYPLYVGLVAGLGEALGGTTIYLTGAGGGTIWAKLRSKRANRAPNNSDNNSNETVPFVTRGMQSWQRAFFNRLVAPLQRWGVAWPIFIAAAMIFGPYYFVGLGAGALKMGLRKFFLISWAGKTLKGLYVAFAGYWGLYFLLRWFGG